MHDRKEDSCLAERARNRGPLQTVWASLNAENLRANRPLKKTRFNIFPLKTRLRRDIKNKVHFFVFYSTVLIYRQMKTARDLFGMETTKYVSTKDFVFLFMPFTFRLKCNKLHSASHLFYTCTKLPARSLRPSVWNSNTLFPHSVNSAFLLLRI